MTTNNTRANLARVIHNGLVVTDSQPHEAAMQYVSNSKAREGAIAEDFQSTPAVLTSSLAKRKYRTTNKENRHDWHHSINHPDTSFDRCSTNVATQQRLGALPRWHHRLAGDHSHRAVDHGQNLIACAALYESQRVMCQQ